MYVLSAAAALLVGFIVACLALGPEKVILNAYFTACRWYTAAARPCNLARKRYPIASSCQIPHFKNLGDLYLYVFGFKTDGVFVEVGAYDGDSFSNTSGLADAGWVGHYIEPVPRFAGMCAARHAANAAVKVHNFAIGAEDGMVELSVAGPMSSACDDEIEAFKSSTVFDLFRKYGWAHNTKEVVKVKTIPLNKLLEREGVPVGFDVLIVDTEGMEWQVMSSFALGRFRPKLVIIEIQEKQLGYRDQPRVVEEAAKLEKYFADNNYSVLYRDIINTVYIDKTVRVRG